MAEPTDVWTKYAQMLNRIRALEQDVATYSAETKRLRAALEAHRKRLYGSGDPPSAGTSDYDLYAALDQTERKP